MSQDDDVERVARAICIDHTIDLRRAQDFARTAITAYLCAMPQRELLAEALEALKPFAVGARSIDVDPPGDHEPSHGRGSVTAGDLRRARAAADKIRASLTQEKQT